MEKESTSGAAGEPVWFMRTGPDTVYGKLNLATLVSWAEQGRIVPGCEVSRNNRDWVLAQTVPELKMDWLVELKNGAQYGPVNLLAIPGLLQRGMIEPGALLENKTTGRKMARASLLRSMVGAASPVSAAALEPVSTSGPADQTVRKVDAQPAARRLTDIAGSEVEQRLVETEARESRLLKQVEELQAAYNRADTELQSAMRIKDRVLGEARGETAELRVKHDALATNARQAELRLTRRINELETLLQERQRSAGVVDEKLRKREGELLEVRTQISDAERQLRATEADRESMLVDLRQERKKHSETRLRMGALEIESQHLQADLKEKLAAAGLQITDVDCEEAERLAARLAEMDASLAAERERARQLADGVEELKRASARQAESFERERSTTQALQAELAEARGLLQRAQSDAGAQAAQVLNLESLKVQLQAQAGDRDQAVAALSESQSRLAKLSTERDDLKAELARLRQEHSIQSDSVRELSSKLESMAAQSRRELAAAASELQKRDERHAADLVRARAELESALEQKLEQNAADVAAKSSAAAEQAAEMKRLSSELAAAQTDAESLKLGRRQAEEELARKEAELSEQSRLVSETKHELEAKSLEQLERQATWELRLTEASAAHAKQVKELETRVEARAGKKERLLAAAKSDAEAKIQKLTQALEEAHAEVERRQDGEARMTSIADALRNELAGMQQSSKRGSEALSAAAAREELMQSEVSNLNRQIQVLTSLLAEATAASADKAEERVVAMKAEFDGRLQSVEMEHARSRTEWEQRLQSVSSERDRVLAEAAERTAKLDRELTALRAAIAEGTELQVRQREDLETRIKSAEADRARMLAELDGLREQLGAEKTAHAAQLDRELGDLRSELQRIRDESVATLDRGRKQEFAFKRIEHELQEVRRAAAKAGESYRSAMAAQLRQFEERFADVQWQNEDAFRELSEVLHGIDLDIQDDRWFVDLGDGNIYGPVSADELYQWVLDCRLGPGHKISCDKADWQNVEEVAELGMEWMARLADGGSYGPLNLFAVRQFQEDGVLAPGAPVRSVRDGREGPWEKMLVAEATRMSELRRNVRTQQKTLAKRLAVARERLRPGAAGDRG